MEVSELLKPRFKVIADYPDSCLEVGEVVAVGENSDFMEPVEWWENYPHLFKKLEWWEDRKPEDMPEYVKRFGDGAIIKPDKWFLVGDDIRWHTKNPWVTMSAETCEPATESDYNEYLNNQTVKQP